MRGLRRPGAGRIAVVAILILATAVLMGRRRGRSTTLSSVHAPPVITLAWHVVGKDVEPWSGLGLGEQVRRALNSRGIVVIDDTRSRSLVPGGGAEVLIDSGRQTHAAFALAGTVGRKGKRSEIGMQLVRVQDGVAVWSSTFWRDPSDLDSLASDLASAVAQVLKAETSQGGEPP